MSVLQNSAFQGLADQLDRSIHGGAWHGPATLEVLERIDAATANRRPGGSPNTIVELVHHITFWIRAAKLRISGEGDVDAKADWQRVEALSESEWAKAIEELEQAHASLRAQVLTLDDKRLDDAVAGEAPTVRGLLLGILQHTAYHTGQIVQVARESKP